MNSKVINKWTILVLLCTAAKGLNLQQQHQLHTSNQGIFGRMIEQVQAPQSLAEERAEAKERKEKQLAEAEKDFQRSVKQEEEEEAAKKKKDDEEAENAALEAAKKTPQAQMLAAANSAASNINVADLESTIQAQLQAKLDSGATKAELLSQMNSTGGEDSLTQTTSQTVVQQSAATSSVSSIMAKVLAKHKQSTAVTTSPPVALAVLPKVAVKMTPVLSQKTSAAEAEAKASQEKVKEMAQKLGIPFTDDLMKLGSNSDISDSLIEKAVAAGKSEVEINKAMASL